LLRCGELKAKNSTDKSGLAGRSRLRSQRFSIFLLVLSGFGAVATVIACQVPVFRYALERWQADRYELIIEAEGNLSPAEQQAVDFLIEKATDREMPTNVIVRGPEPKPEAEDSSVSAPAKMSLHYPGRMRGLLTKPIWTGAVSMENAARVVDSPARRELMRRILRGDSAVWVIVDSGDSEKDQAAEAQLTESMTEAGGKLEIPDGVIGQDSEPTGGYVDPENVLQSDVPLKIGFSVMRIQRTEPDEQVFLQMLLNIEDDLGEYADQPIVFPVFGRGRFLEPLIGLGVTRDNVFEASMYLCGACSCEVKDQNPGMDLLMSMNWDLAMEGSQVIIDKILPPLEGAAALLQAPVKGGDAETVANIGGATLDDSHATGVSDQIENAGKDSVADTGSLTRDLVVTVATVVLLVLAAGSFFILRRRAK